MNTNKVLIWVKNFKSTWLPRNILNDTHLLELLSNKIQELENLLNQNHQDENEILIESEHQNVKPNDTEQRSLSTSADIHNKIDDENHKTEKLYRPTIRLKRISLAEAEHFLPATLKTTKSKGGKKKSKRRSSAKYSNSKKNKKNTQRNKIISSSTTPDETANKSNGIRKSARSKKPTHPPSTISLTNTQTNNSDKKKKKKKLRAIDAEDDDLFIIGNLSQTQNQNNNTDCDQISRYIGQHGILSQTRKTNETTTTTYEDDFTIKLNSRQSTQSRIIFSNASTDNDLNPFIIESPLIGSVPIDEDVNPMSEDQMFQDVMDNDESLFTSLNLTHDRTPETNSILNNNSLLNYDDCIEDITNDGIDPPPSSSPHLDHISLTT